MALLPQYDTPASLRDAPAGSPFYAGWDSRLRGLFDNRPGDGGGRFYDATDTNVNIVARKSLTWMGFPRTQMIMFRDDKRQAYSHTDNPPPAPTEVGRQRRFQDEYFEWFVERAPDGKIRKVTFTTELPEYYQELWEADPMLVVNLYRTLHGNPAITQADLGGATYNVHNPWNTSNGIVHDIMVINTLSAAVGLSEGSASTGMVRLDNFHNPVSSPATSVDPRVAIDVNMLVRKGLHVTLDDPAAIYMVEWNDSGFSKPDGTPVGNYWQIIRGTPGRVVRLVYEVPPAEGFLVGDIKIGGHPIEFGGQIAEHITVSITGAAGTPA